MRNRRDHVRYPVVLMLALAGLIIGTTPFLASSGLASAQTAAPGWSYTGSLNTTRSVYTTTLLPNGKVLVAGGFNADGVLASAELYDPSTGTWSLTGTLNAPRVGHSATLLLNGKVLFVGGSTRDSSNHPVLRNSAELYDPNTGTWSLTGNLNVPRVDHTATLLQDGKVLVAAGGGDDGQTPLSSAELYDPATGTWTIAGQLNTAGKLGYATLLPNGKVLVVSGCADPDCFTIPGSAELYDPNTGAWSYTGGLNTARLIISATTMLPNGNVLVAGGEGRPFPFTLDSVELYNPATGRWSYTGSLSSRRSSATATLLPSGQVLVAAGNFAYGPGGPVVFNSAELYDPATGNWQVAASLNTERFGHTATLLLNGKVLVVGGYGPGSNNPLQSAELYDSGGSSTINPIDDPQFFVRQQYLDFLNREPDAPGLAHWAGEITACNDPSQRQPGESLALCIERKRPNTSAAFFLSPEFQYTGYFVYRLYKGSLIQNGAGRFPTYQEFLRDVRQVANGIIQNNQLSAAVIEQNKKTFTEEFTKRAEFRSLYDPLSNFDYVERLFQTTGIDVSANEKQALVDGLNNQTETRASVLQKVVDGTVVIAEGNQQFTTSYGRAFYQKEFNAAFVLMEYFGYLHRDPDAPGYQHWLDKLNFYGNFNDAEMVRSFILSPEYRARFGQP